MSHLAGDGLEHVRRCRAPRHEHRDPPERRLLVGEHAELFAAPLELALSAPQLSLRMTVLGDVACDSIDEPLVGLGEQVPLKPPVRAVRSGEPVLEPGELAGLEHAGERGHRPLAVIGVDDVEQPPPDDLLLSQSEHALDPRVDA